MAEPGEGEEGYVEVVDELDGAWQVGLVLGLKVLQLGFWGRRGSMHPHGISMP